MLLLVNSAVTEISNTQPARAFCAARDAFGNFEIINI